jgi:hypothetical protein
MELDQKEKFYFVGLTKYHMPEPTWQQLKLVSRLLEGIMASVPGEENQKGKETLRAFLVVKKLMQLDAGPMFLSYVLAPAGEEWKRMWKYQARKLFKRAGEKTIVSVMEDFFSGRGSLIAEYAPSLLKFLVSTAILSGKLQINLNGSNSPDPKTSTPQTATTGQPSSSAPLKEPPKA